MKKDTTAPGRGAAGEKAGFAGLGANLFLFAVKMTISLFSGSVSIAADAINNLMDCVSAAITIFGFMGACRSGDRRHPYGHGRLEYICGFMIANLIIITGFSVGRDAFLRLIRPREVTMSGLFLAILAGSAAIKFGMAYYTGRQNRTLNSPTLKAVQKDNISDGFVTLGTVLSFLLSPFIPLPVDAIVGLLVSLMILWSGFQAFGENIVLLLGVGIDAKTEKEIRGIILDSEFPQNVERVTLHDYGPEEKIVFIRLTFKGLPDTGDNVEKLRELKRRIDTEFQTETVLYWDVLETCADSRPL